MEEATQLRLRSALSSWLTVLLVLSLVVGTAGAWATYTAHVDSGTTTVERTVTEWSVSGSFNHSATVTNSNPLYPVGTTLTNRSTYFRPVAPILNGSFTVGTSDLEEITSVELAATLVLQSTDEETTYWTDTRPLNTTMQPGTDGQTSVGFSINTTAVTQQIAAIEEGIGSTPGETSAAVIVDVRIAGTTDDGAESRLTFTSRLPIALSGDTYVVSGPGTVTEGVQRTVTDRVPQEDSPLRSTGGPIALIVGLVSLGGLGFVAGRDQPTLTGAERARLEFLNDRSEFDEWIVSVRLPDDTAGLSTAEAMSLADLVNLAIDSDAAVMENTDERSFHVVTDEYHYRYRPPMPVDRQRDSGDALSGEADPVFSDQTGETEDGTADPDSSAPNTESAVDATDGH